METIQANKQIAVKFLELVVAGKVDEAYETYVDMGGRHHNPHYAAGFAALKAGMKESGAQMPPRQIVPINVIAEGDRVAVHSRLLFESSQMTVAHVFRFERQKIVEMWDLGMELPAESPNQDGAF